MKQAASSSTDKGQFYVAAKVLLRDKDKLLLLHDVFSDWDLPGGRILPSEFGGDIQNVVRRKMHEELGPDIQYELGGIDTYFQVTRTEHDTGNESQIFAVGFTACYLGGNIQLGNNHDRYKWVQMSNLNPSEYFKHGWETGVERYIVAL